ncbi:MAG: hypothetical protein DRI26_07110 [Chloroflexi bacterium]|nr:MAG: hypothetical protein DRI26_07110 [Chloroflexota bacterium]
MSNIDIYIMMGMGGFFILLGLLAMLWARQEERGYYDAVSRRRDLREFLTRFPQRIEPGALRAGGWILITIGSVLIIIGGVFLL